MLRWVRNNSGSDGLASGERRPRWRFEFPVLRGDLFLETLQADARLDPEFVDERVTRVLVRLRRFGLPA